MKLLIFAAIVMLPFKVVAATFTVDSMANGGFGFTNIVEPFEPLAEGPLLESGQQIQISATGLVDPGGGAVTPSGPDGRPFDFTNVDGASPLLEALGLSNVLDPNSIALLGYFVPASQGDVEAFDIDQGGDLPVSGLFLVGSSFSYTAPEAGTLFFGINDPRVSNNSGAYNVTVSDPNVVPLPASTYLLLGALGLLGLMRRKV